MFVPAALDFHSRAWMLDGGESIDATTRHKSHNKKSPLHKRTLKVGDKVRNHDLSKPKPILAPLLTKRCIMVSLLFRCVNFHMKMTSFTHHFHTSFYINEQTNMITHNHYACASFLKVNRCKMLRVTFMQENVLLRAARMNSVDPDSYRGGAHI